MSDRQISSLVEMLDRIRHVTREHDPVTMDLVMEAIGRRSFGALMLLAGLMVLAPIIGDIPGVPTIMSIFVFLISIQLVARRNYFWMPRWLETRSVEAQKLANAVEKLHRPAQYIDRLIKPRLTFLIDGRGTHAVAIACVIIALLMPPMELIPFSANIAGVALSLFGLAYIGRDGLLALVAFTLTFAGVGVLAWSMI